MSAKPVKLPGKGFPSITAALAEFRRILNDDVPGTMITGVDAEHVDALLLTYSKKLDEIAGRRVIGFKRDYEEDPGYRLVHTVCFWIILEDGSKIHFSFHKAVHALAN